MSPMSGLYFSIQYCWFFWASSMISGRIRLKSSAYSSSVISLRALPSTCESTEKYPLKRISFTCERVQT